MHRAPRRPRSRPRSVATLAAVALAATLAPRDARVATAADVPPRVLLVAGSPVPGVGTVLQILDVAVGDDGTWLARVRTDFANPSRDEVILRNGVVWLREGDGVPEGGDPVITNPAGDLAMDGDDRSWTVVTDVDGGAGPALVIDGSAMLRAGDPADGAGLPPEAVWSDLLAAVPTGAGGALLLGGLLAEGVPRDALVIAAPPVVPGAPPSLAGALLEGDAIAGLGVVGRITGAGSEAVAAARDGTMLASVDLDGESPSTDGAVLRRRPGEAWIAVAREGDPSPVRGRVWSGLQGRSVAVGPGGSWAVQGSLSGSPSSNQVLVRDGSVVRQEGDEIVLDDGVFLLQGFGVGPLRILPDGRLAWLADWNDTIGFDRGIFVGGSLVLRAGTTSFDGVDLPGGDGTPVDGVRLSGLDLGPSNWDVSPSGAWLVARGTVQDPETGADRAAIARVLLLPPCAADADADGAVGFMDLLAVLVHYGAADHPADVDGDRDVDFADLVLVLSTWGPCGP
jgi:hypothetical protein